jgi:hypothetical protein
MEKLYVNVTEGSAAFGKITNELVEGLTGTNGNTLLGFVSAFYGASTSEPVLEIVIK